MQTAKPNHPVTGVLNSATDVAGDLVELAELQVKLVRMDLTSMLNRSLLPIALLAIGAILGVAALPSVTIGLSQLLAATTDLAPWAAQLLVGVGLVLLAFILVCIALVQFRSALTQLNNSTAELAKNVAWLKKVIRGKS